MTTSFSYRFSPGSEKKVVISVSKKTAKLAVTRNLVKRRVRAALRPLLPRLALGTHLLIARAGADKAKGATLKEELATLLRYN